MAITSTRAGGGSDANATETVTVTSREIWEAVRSHNIVAAPLWRREKAALVDPLLIREGMKATDMAKQADRVNGGAHSVVSYTDGKGVQRFTSAQPATLEKVVRGTPVYDEHVSAPGTPRIDGHTHGRDGSASFSLSDVRTGQSIPVMKPWKGHETKYDMYYRGWRSFFDSNGRPVGTPSPYHPYPSY